MGLARVRAFPGAIGSFFLLLAMARTSDLLRKWGYHEFEPCREQLAVFSSCNGSNSRPFKNLENGAIASSSLPGNNWQFFFLQWLELSTFLENGASANSSLAGSNWQLFSFLQWLELATFLENGASANSSLVGSNCPFFFLLAMARTRELFRKWG